MKELAKIQVKHIPQFMEDAAETQWSSSELPVEMSRTRKGLHFTLPEIEI